jgi:sulfite oxidase
MNRRAVLSSGAFMGGSVLVNAHADAASVVTQLLGRPQDFETPLGAFDRAITKTEQFFVRSHFGAPAMDASRRLTITGTRKVVELDAAQLQRYKNHSVTAVLQCSGNGRGLHEPHIPGIQWHHGAMGQAIWSGVRLCDLAEDAGIPGDTKHFHLQGHDRPMAPKVPAFLRSLPLERALDPTTLVATHMNGKPLTAAHGAPFRLVVPGWGGQHWLKWLQRIVASPTEAEGFFQRTAYRIPKTPVAPGTAVKPEDTVAATVMPVRSVIARPSDGAALKKGPQEIVGVAFSGEAAIATVEVSIDGGNTWSKAGLEGKAGIGTWQVFRHRLTAKPGDAWKIMARATDERGATQPQSPIWNPSGYFWNAWHTINVVVS